MIASYSHTRAYLIKQNSQPKIDTKVEHTNFHSFTENGTIPLNKATFFQLAESRLLQIYTTKTAILTHQIFMEATVISNAWAESDPSILEM